MQIKAVVLSLFVAAATAQSIQELANSIPDCAKPCIAKASADAGCGVTDAVCQCKKQQDIQMSGATCVTTSCTTNPEDIQKTLQISVQICAEVAKAAGGAQISGAIGQATSALGNLTASATKTATTGTPTAVPAGAIRNGAALGMAAVAAVMAL